MQYELAQIEREHTAKVDEYNRAEYHPMYSKPCKNCGRQFVGRDWRLIPSEFCCKTCELAATKKNNPYRRAEINLFWRDFGQYIKRISD